MNKEIDFIKINAAFLVESVFNQNIFTPENISEEHSRMAKIAQEFMDKEILPKVVQIEQIGPSLMHDLIEKAGTVGLLAADIPRLYGGQETGLKLSAVLATQLSREYSFFVAWSVQTGIGSLPIIYFGSERLKAKYLPNIALGKLVVAYAVTEAEAGSDAMSITTQATHLLYEKQYILNGAKKWISNAGFADLFIVFAKVNDTKFTEFIVETKWKGISIGPEEKKMGIQGSSNSSVYFDNVEVPSENILWDIGRGPKIISSVINIGRAKLAVGSAGMCQEALNHSLQHASQRRAFGKPIHQFGLIQKKIADMTVETYTVESIAFRVMGDMDDSLNQLDFYGKLNGFDIIEACIKEHTIVASIAKIFGSEASGRVIDEAVQIFGGSGYMKGHPIERAYRDIRISRIFEGTNEINRLLISGTLLKQILSSQCNLVELLTEIETHLLGNDDIDDVPSALSTTTKILAKTKWMVLYAIIAGALKFLPTIEQEQECLGYIADMIIYIYAIDSTFARAFSTVRRKHNDREMHILVANLAFVHYIPQIQNNIVAILHATFEGNDLVKVLKKVHDIMGIYHIDIIESQRKLAAIAINAKKYPFLIKSQ